MFENTMTRKSFVRATVVAAGLAAALSPLSAALASEAAPADAAEPAAAEQAVAAEGNWAYAALPMDSAETGIGTVYYTAAYYAAVTAESIDPTTAAPYAEGVVDGIVAGADAEGAEGYVAAPEGAVLGISAFDGTAESQIFWYDEAAAASILSSADPLAVSPETGEVTAADGTVLAEAMQVQWAYGALPMDSAELGIGTVFYTAAYYAGVTAESIDPTTAAPYAEGVVDGIVAGAGVKGAAGYVTAPAGAVVGISTFDGTAEGAPFWYDADNAAAIFSSADPLAVSPETGEVTAADGTVLAEPIAENWAYGAIAVNSEEAGVGTVYYAAGYFAVEDPATLVNPLTAAPYTAEEVQAIVDGASAEGAEGYVAAPDDATLGISVFGGDTIYWYGADAAAQIVTFADPLTLNAETGELTAADGSVVAEALAE